MPDMSPALPSDLMTALRELAAVLEHAQIRYALIGGIATGFHAQPRFTEVLDFLLEVPILRLPGLLQELRERGFAAEDEVILREWSREHMAVLSFRGLQIDWLKPVIPLYQHVINRARAESWRGTPIRIASPEGLILLKLLAFRAQDQLDIDSLLIANAGQLDLAFIREEWLTVASADEPRYQWFEKHVRQASPPPP